METQWGSWLLTTLVCARLFSHSGFALSLLPAPVPLHPQHSCSRSSGLQVAERSLCLTGQAGSSYLPLKYPGTQEGCRL